MDSKDWRLSIHLNSANNHVGLEVALSPAEPSSEVPERAENLRALESPLSPTFLLFCLCRSPFG